MRFRSIDCIRRFAGHMLLSVIFLFLISGAAVAESGEKGPGPKDRCTVCGMFVSKFPAWIAKISFKDGTVLYFDGPKDMFKGYFNLEKYAPKQKKETVAEIRVRDYYSTQYIDAARSFFVIGSDVYGPMGKELVPFEKEADSWEFMKDHKGRRVLKFNEITPADMRMLE